MAKLFKQRITRYLDAQGKRVKAGAKGARKVVEKSSNWYGQYSDANRKKVRVPLCRDKQASREMLAALIDKVRRQRLGLDDPQEERFAAQRRRPLAEHLDDYRRDLIGRNNCPAHVQKTVSQCKAVLEGCNFSRIEDVEESAVVELLAGLRGGQPVAVPPRDWFTPEDLAGLFGITAGSVRRLARRGLLGGAGQGQEQRYPRSAVETLAAERSRGVGIETTNHYTVAIKSFFKWLVKNRRIGSDPLVHLSTLNADVDVRHERRALTAAEFGMFLDATAAGKPFRGLAGPDRIVLYCVAARTGLRASELGSLTPTSFDLAATPPLVTVQAGYSKHRRKDVLPLAVDVAALLADYLEGRPADAPLWPGSWTVVGAEMVRRDLETAGLPYRDGQGCVLDFHGLRHTFLTHLAESGVHPKVAQVLARHSTITLTMDRYTHMRAVDVAGDLDKLPPLPIREKGTGKQKEGAA